MELINIFIKAAFIENMVLAYFPTPQADPLILDNLVPEIRPASRRQDLVPVYSFNVNGLWLAKARGIGKRLRPRQRVPACKCGGDIIAQVGLSHRHLPV